MAAAETVTTLLKRDNGYLTARVAKENGMGGKALQNMTLRGIIERVAHGLYVGADIFPDLYYIVQYRCPKGVFSHETALFLHGLSDRVPLKLMMTIPSGWNSQLLMDDTMLFFYSRQIWMGLGICDLETPLGMRVRAYDTERTLCDCLRNIEKLDRDIVLTALKQYVKGNGRDSAKLLEYASTLKIREIVYRYLEVLV
jgi:predicted transcriptional regulator of viral defense system